MAIVPQEPILFEETLRYNVDPIGNYSDTEIWEALEKSNLKNVIENLPNKLDSIVMANGSNFSFGQQQLLCFARALVKKSKLIILDGK